MHGDTVDDLRQVLLPIDSLISKSEKAQRRLDSATWQHAMLQRNLDALRIARELLEPRGGRVEAASLEDLSAALAALDSMISRVENAKSFAPGTATHSLQRNRLYALRIAAAATRAELERR